MTTTESSADVIIDAVRKLAPEIAERAEEIERDRAVPADLLDRMADTGVLRRDVRAAARHAAASAEIYTILGALLAGEPVPPAALN